jgi:AraC-like DNA-binding protein
MSIDKGQFEGAAAVGMTHVQTMVHVVIPQVMRNILPSISNEFVINIKDTSVLNVIGVTELYFQASILQKITWDIFETYLVVCVIYFILTFTVTRLLRLCEKYVISESKGKTANSAAAARIKAVMTYMRSHLSEPVTLDEIAEHAGVSKYHLSREFKLSTGATIFDSLNILRCKEARHLLSSGATVSEAAHACGFENLSYFSRTFKKYTGKLPSEYAKGKAK